jgi:hypothetical protein
MRAVIKGQKNFFAYRGWKTPQAGGIELFQPERGFRKIEHMQIYSEAVDMNNLPVLTENFSVVF